MLAGAAQPRPVSQVSPAQQALPAAPQGAQVNAVPPSPAAAWQESPAVQVVVPAPWQHAAPSAPQATHLPAVQRVPGAVQVPRVPPQQLSPRPPQAVMPVPHFGAT